MIRKTALVGVVAFAAAWVSGSSSAEEVAIGAKAPEFQAEGVDGKDYCLACASKDAKVTVLCFTCNGCPVAMAYEDRLIEFAKKYAGQGVKLIAINCNNATENLEAMKKRSDAKKFSFPYVFDESGDAARAYGARVTPHLFVVDSAGKVAYRGAFDDNQNKPTEHYLVNAVDALRAGKKPAKDSTNAFGCSIKLK